MGPFRVLGSRRAPREIVTSTTDSSWRGDTGIDQEGGPASQGTDG